MYRKRLKKYSTRFETKKKQSETKHSDELRVGCEDILLESIKAEFKLKKLTF
jgi:hypothetical protein